MPTVPATRKRFLLGQLAARGDCLYATTVARQIKADYPYCHLTWAIGSMCRGIIEGNPHVDAVWEVPLATHAEVESAWHAFVAEAEVRRRNGEFDEVFYTQIFPGNYRHFDGTVRASIFRGYPRPITVPVAPVVQLTAGEIENVRRFAEAHNLAAHNPVILFEFMHNGGQSFVGSDFVYAAIDGITAQLPDCRIILSSQLAIDAGNPAVISANTLTFRENAELTKYCTLLIGCSSGITWLCTSDWAKPLPQIQLLNRHSGVYASVVHDHAYFGLPAGHVIEMTDCPARDLVDCAVTAVRQGVAPAKQRYHRAIGLCFDFHRGPVDFLIAHGAWRDVFGTHWRILRRYGPRPAVIQFIAITIWRSLCAMAAKLVRH
jgi:hypothetical protein